MQKSFIHLYRSLAGDFIELYRDMHKDVKKYLKQLGKKGGNNTKKKYGSEYYKKIGEMGLKKRYKKNNL